MGEARRAAKCTTAGSCMTCGTSAGAPALPQAEAAITAAYLAAAPRRNASTRNGGETVVASANDGNTNFKLVLSCLEIVPTGARYIV